LRLSRHDPTRAVAEPIRIRTRTRPDATEVTILMPHPMETGLRLDESGRTVPARYITDFTVTVGERPVFSARMSIAVARDPLLRLRIAAGLAGQRLRVAWTDNLGDTRSDEAVIA
jgi:sulfur-oxidizing protein SoxZ